jgi:hypothetical protein
VDGRPVTKDDRRESYTDVVFKQRGTDTTGRPLDPVEPDDGAGVRRL